MPYAGLLPWDEASTQLSDALRHPDAELRGQALASLIFSVRYDRGRQGELLALLTARRNEQDPVRNRILEGLASLPPGLWQPASLNALGQVIRDALNAADLSGATGLAAERLVVALLPFHPQWGATWLAILVQARGQVNLRRLGERLSTRLVQTVMPALLPVLHAWETREREGALLQALRSFGRFLKEVPELLSLLERLVRQAATSFTSVGALSLLAEHARERFALLVPQLLNKDASWATQPLVYTHLHEQRQDLLTPFLGRQAFSGRFSTGRTRFVLPIGDGFARWTLHQQQVFAQTLIEVSRDAVRDIPSVISALRQLAALPSPVRLQAASPGTFLGRLRGTGAPQEDPPLRRLTELAALDTSDLALRDTALRLLGRLDTARGVPALLDTLEDDRARIAIYTLRRPLLNLPPAEALRLLLQVPRDRVTVLKEVVRLIGDLPGDAAYHALLDLSEQPLHRDVRVAVLRGFWNHLNRPATWPVLLAAASSADAALSDGLVRLPLHALQDEYRGQALSLLVSLLTHPEPMVRLETLQFQTFVTDPERRVLGVLLQTLASPHTEEARAAGRVIFSSYTGRDAPVVAAAFTHLLAQPRALVTATNALQTAALASRRQAAPLVRAVLQALAADPLTMQLQVDLAVSTLDWTELGEQLQRWADAHLLHAEALMGAVNALLKARHRTDVQEVETLEQQLAGAGVESRRLALAALVLSAQAPGSWTPERLERLRRYRADPSVLVASAAHFTLPAAETEERGNAQV
ncbi:hypothetical protein MF271_22445 (plasmid) [Deinococcus sp. KNUC1210]|uniref:hypothetical protein n=1 Tax=Deinococcus sp. KNUC1210 TaxID=2917691 RepID=UPI001EF14190|nr:hypothetical protein [Deinococcus sp. KNUC1210]ULH18229.1 hypothetical protein MF271_22445 [Deinococcus sp. KNUC1210]